MYNSIALTGQRNFFVLARRPLAVLALDASSFSAEAHDITLDILLASSPLDAPHSTCERPHRSNVECSFCNLR